MSSLSLLIVAATVAELAPFIAQHGYARTQDKGIVLLTSALHPHTDILITGVGMVATAYSLTKAFSSGKYTAAVQAGVGGSYNTAMPLGTVVAITADTIADLRADDNGTYLSMFSIGLIDGNQHPYTQNSLPNPHLEHPIWHAMVQRLPQMPGYTVNTVSGHAPAIAANGYHLLGTVETMEGAAFHYACLMEGIPFVQLRAISNYITPRNRKEWQMERAIATLNATLPEVCVGGKS
ncbi:MAG: futalosine hydrolase [Chitinophagia bacterium]|nr:futalosine hydrolase [Chitinophagia bacterium]